MCDLTCAARRSEHEAFRIDPKAGLVTLARSVLGGADFYPLNITAYDDGSCCSDGNRRSTDGYIVVQVVDINTHKPTFDRCSDYSNAKIKEHSRIGDVVVQVGTVTVEGQTLSGYSEGSEGRRVDFDRVQ